MNNKVLSLLIILLVIASFLAGSFWTKTRYLKSEKGEIAQLSPTPTVAAQGQAPTPAVLDREARNEIEKDGAAVKGDENAPVTIVEFSEYLCPFCAEYVGVDVIPSRPIDEERTYQQIIKNYVDTGKARYIFRDFPVHGEKAKKIAQAAHCAGGRGKYWEYHDLLFERQKDLSEATDLEDLLKTLASELNLDIDEFNLCLTDNEVARVVDDNYELGKRVGVSGTPSFFINGHMLVGAQPFENFKKIIEEELR